MFFLQEILHDTWTMIPLGHTLSLNKVNYAYITIIIKWKFTDTVFWLERIKVC